MGQSGISPGIKRIRYMLAVILGAFLCVPSFAQEDVNRGSVTISYQYAREGKVATTIGDIDIGSSDTQSLLLDVEFSLNSKWDIFGSLPFMRKRYNGHRPHDPDTLNLDVHESLIDDGNYHSDFQDFSFGMRYKLLTSNFRLAPFISVGVPSSNYPIYAHASVGQRLKKAQIGADISFQPLFSDFYYTASVSRVFTEKTHVNVDHWRLNGEIGYFLNPRLSVNVFFFGRTGNGLKFPDDFPPPRNDIRWYEHERLLKIEYIYLGAGVDWMLDDRHRISFSALTTVHAEFIHNVDYAVSFGVSRAF